MWSSRSLEISLLYQTKPLAVCAGDFPKMYKSHPINLCQRRPLLRRVSGTAPLTHIRWFLLLSRCFIVCSSSSLPSVRPSVRPSPERHKTWPSAPPRPPKSQSWSRRAAAAASAPGNVIICWYGREWRGPIFLNGPFAPCSEIKEIGHR